MLCFDYLGLKAAISTQNEAFRDHLRSNYGAFLTDATPGQSADINVELDFANAGDNRASKWMEEAKKKNPWTLGTSLNSGENSIFYHYGPNLICASKSEDGLRISAMFAKTRKFRISAMMDKSRWHEAFQSIMRLCVHFPMFGLLQERGYSVLHSSAVVKNGKAVLFFGLNGAGKTTSALALAPQMTLVADNFLLCDGDYVYGFPETTRVSKETAVACNIDSGGKEIFGKFQKDNTLNPGEIKAKAILTVICRRGKENKWEEMSRVKALAYAEAADRFLHETHAYSYMTFLTRRKEADRYPDCPYFMATLGDFQSARNMIREKAGGLIGL
jgi:hypothetical protein